ncbi:MAG: nucleotide sugar dehydrogenase, partial [Rubrivivax sp.]
MAAIEGILQMSRVCVVGLGYMGLPMAAILAKHGHDVVGVDINPEVVARVNEGVCPFVEPGMPELVSEAHASGRLKAVGVPEAAEIFVLSLPTPVDHSSHEADMRFVEAGAQSIAAVLQGGELVVLESTSPIGATRRNVVEVIEGLRPELVGKVDYVFCPERAIPGNTLKEMIGNDRLVGGLTPQAGERAKALYASFCTGALLDATTEEAEMVKLVENASRDAQIAFANELSLVCDRLGLDVWKVIQLANHHPRVNILTPGPGVGGHCIAV